MAIIGAIQQEKGMIAITVLFYIAQLVLQERPKHCLLGINTRSIFLLTAI